MQHLRQGKEPKGTRDRAGVLLRFPSVDIYSVFSEKTDRLGDHILSDTSNLQLETGIFKLSNENIFKNTTTIS